MLPNGKEFLRAWFGLNYLGAVVATGNTAYRGGALEHVVDLIAAKLAVMHTQLTDRLVNKKLAKLERILEVGEVSHIDLSTPETPAKKS